MKPILNLNNVTPQKKHITQKKENVKMMAKQEEFLENKGAVVVKPLRTAAGDMLGWAISRNDITLERDRGGVRTFKSKDSVDKFCIKNGIDSYLTQDLL